MVFEKGKAGESTRRLADKRYLGRVLVTLIGIFAIFLLIFMSINLKVKGIMGLVVLGTIIMAMKIISKQTSQYEKLEKRASKGAQAEERIGDLLKQLHGDYAVFHDIESPYGNIDHVVMNKDNDVFLLETKSHHGEITYNGKNLLINSKPTEKDFISQALKNMYWLKDEIKKQTNLNLFIKSIIVFINAFVKIPKPIKNISIINKKYLIKTLMKKNRHFKTPEKDPDKIGLFTALTRLQKNNTNNSRKQ